jgi:hypothetical protein
MREKQARPRLVGRCPRCRKVQPLTRHHIVPRSEGGPDEEDNIELLCRPCHNALHRMSVRARSVSRAQRQARRTRIKAYRAQVKFECRPLINKCRDCQAVCMNFVLELLAIFFRWLDEMTSEAMRTASA